MDAITSVLMAIVVLALYHLWISTTQHKRQLRPIKISRRSHSGNQRGASNGKSSVCHFRR